MLSLIRSIQRITVFTVRFCTSLLLTSYCRELGLYPGVAAIREGSPATRGGQQEGSSTRAVEGSTPATRAVSRKGARPGRSKALPQRPGRLAGRRRDPGKVSGSQGEAQWPGVIASTREKLTKSSAPSAASSCSAFFLRHLLASRLFKAGELWEKLTTNIFGPAGSRRICVTSAGVATGPLCYVKLRIPISLLFKSQLLFHVFRGGIMVCL